MFKNKKKSVKIINALRFHTQIGRRGLISLLAGSCLLMGSATAVADIGVQKWQEIFNVDDGNWRMAQFKSAGFRSDGS